MECRRVLVALLLALVALSSCEVGEKQQCQRSECQDDKHLLVCEDFALGDLIECPGVCWEHACVACNPTRPSLCTEEGAGWRACNPDGSFGEQHACAEPAPVCWRGACRACNSDLAAMVCVESSLYRCDAGSLELVETCSGEQGTCTPAGCRECDPDGAPPPLCRDGRVAVCVNGSLAGGSPCPSGAPYCLEGGCIECEPDTLPTVCIGNSPPVCVAGGWVAGAPCTEPRPACRSGRCGACDPDAVNAPGCFDGTSIRACSDAGEWIRGTACGPGLVCWEGRCVACDPGLSGPRCANACTRTVQGCVGGSWQSIASCGAGLECVTGSCGAPLQDSLGPAGSPGAGTQLLPMTMYLTPAFEVPCRGYLHRFLVLGAFSGSVQFALYRGGAPFERLVSTNPLDYVEGGLEPGAVDFVLESGPYHIAVLFSGSTPAPISTSVTTGVTRAVRADSLPTDVSAFGGTAMAETPALGLILEHAPSP